MNYELAKRLKDAGFFNRKRKLCGGNGCTGLWNLECEDENHPKIDLDVPYIPTLSELIEAFNTEFLDLIKLKDGWAANDHYRVGKGKTPEESVANLWLKLNE